MKHPKYEAVIGLEVHAQLLSKTKIFAGEKSAYGAAPNSQVSAITMALPGTLPKLNNKVIEMATKMGIACHSKISEYNYFERKNYFYPDLPKGFQTSQDKAPICVGGFVTINFGENAKNIALTRIHLEEDAGKNNHDIDDHYSMIDLNRAGTPLIEIVTEPVITSADDAHAFLLEVRRLVRYLEICDGNMEEGSLRCDANVSIRLKGVKELGTKVEVKNMNSAKNVKRAIEKELERQVHALENGEMIEQQTRSFNPNDGSSFPLRSKELAHDYRYFPEPDLPPIQINQQQFDSIKSKMPKLPIELYEDFTEHLGLSDYDAKVIIDDKQFASYFQAMVALYNEPKTIANWLMGTVKSYLNDESKAIQDISIEPERMVDLLKLVADNKLSKKNAKPVFYEMLNKPNTKPLVIAEGLNLVQEENDDALATWITQTLEKFPDKVLAYQKGKKNLMGLFMGEVMKLSKGKANPKTTMQLLKEKLDKK